MDSQKLNGHFMFSSYFHHHESSCVFQESPIKTSPNYSAITKKLMIVMFLLNITIAVSYLQIYLSTNCLNVENKLLNKKYVQKLVQISEFKQQFKNLHKFNEENEYLHLQRKYYPYLLNEPNKCKDNKGKNLPVFLLVAVKSKPKNFAKRDAIRETWGNESLFEGIVIKRLFLLATDNDDRNQLLLKVESSEHKDIVQGSFSEHFRNLTKKDFMFLRWFVKHCPQAKYIYKGDDDVFANIFNIMEYILFQNPKATKHLILGSTLLTSPRITDPLNKYFVSSKVFKENVYPPYVSGGGFIMSSLIAKKIFLVMQTIPVIPIDDAYLGICLKQLKILPQQHKGFKSWEKPWKSLYGKDSPNRICYLQSAMTVHHVDGTMLIEAWKLLLVLMNEPKKYAVVCSKRFEVVNNTLQRLN